MAPKSRHLLGQTSTSPPASPPSPLLPSPSVFSPSLSSPSVAGAAEEGAAAMAEEDGSSGLLTQEEKEEARSGEGDSEWDDLKASLAHVTDVWRVRAQGAHSAWVSTQRKVEGRAEWRVTLGEALESTTTHVLIVVLLLVDLLATAIDILKEIHVNHEDLRDCIERVESCYVPSSFEQREVPWEWLGYVGIAILLVLLLNVIGLLVAFGKSFFSHPGYVLDLVVVVTALCLEIFLEADTAGLLVILTLWRIVRVAHGIFSVTDEAWESEVKKLEERLQAVESSHKKDLQLLKEREERIANLEYQCAQNERYNELGLNQESRNEDSLYQASLGREGEDI